LAARQKSQHGYSSAAPAKCPISTQDLAAIESNYHSHNKQSGTRAVVFASRVASLTSQTALRRLRDTSGVGYADSNIKKINQKGVLWLNG
jgi:hypothetical protein